MKKVVFIFIGLLSFTYFAFGDEYVYEYVYSTRSTKTVEDNLQPNGSYNFAGKKWDEKLLFGDFNADIEFFHQPSFAGVSGFRVFRDSLKGDWILEIKRVCNHDEVNKKLDREFPLQRVGIDTDFSEVMEELQRTGEHNRVMLANQNRELPGLLKVETISYQIYDWFAIPLYETIRNAIESYPIEIKTRGMIMDGNTAVFRCRVNDKILTLNYHVPEGEIKKLTDICLQVIIDAMITGNFDPGRYQRELKVVDFRTESVIFPRRSSKI